jgi:Flp pilus assembly protein CpaB
MADASTGSCRAGVCRNFVPVALLILLAVTTTGWVVTATRNRPHAPVTVPPAREPVVAPPIAPGPTLAPLLPTFTNPDETIELLVAARELYLGTQLTRDEIGRLVEWKKVPKKDAPATYITDPEKVLDLRLVRPIRSGDVLSPFDLTRGAPPTLPPDRNLVSLALSPGDAAGGFVGPASKVDVNATFQRNDKVLAFPLLVDLLVVAVDTQGTEKAPEVIVSFAVTQKEALILGLAKARGCRLSLMLRHPSQKPDPNYNIDDVIKVLSNDPRPAPVPANEGQNVSPPEPLEVAPPPRPVGAGR